jgi:hypothetical protein
MYNYYQSQWPRLHLRVGSYNFCCDTGEPRDIYFLFVSTLSVMKYSNYRKSWGKANDAATKVLDSCKMYLIQSWQSAKRFKFISIKNYWNYPRLGYTRPKQCQPARDVNDQRGNCPSPPPSNSSSANLRSIKKIQMMLNDEYWFGLAESALWNFLLLCKKLYDRDSFMLTKRCEGDSLRNAAPFVKRWTKSIYLKDFSIWRIRIRVFWPLGKVSQKPKIWTSCIICEKLVIIAWTSPPSTGTPSSNYWFYVSRPIFKNRLLDTLDLLSKFGHSFDIEYNKSSTDATAF